MFFIFLFFRPSSLTPFFAFPKWTKLSDLVWIFPRRRFFFGAPGFFPPLLCALQYDLGMKTPQPSSIRQRIHTSFHSPRDSPVSSPLPLAATFFLHSSGDVFRAGNLSKFRVLRIGRYVRNLSWFHDPPPSCLSKTFTQYVLVLPGVSRAPSCGHPCLKVGKAQISIDE